MTTQPPGEPDTADTAAVPTCYRHPGRETYVRCQRCERPICPDCMRDASVGFQCPECVAEGGKTVRRTQAVFGGRPVGTPYVVWTLLVVNVLAYGAQFLDPGVIVTFSTFSPAIHEGEWWRLVTGAFLHAQPGRGFSITHILFNMLALYVIGPQLERSLGSLRFLALYLLSALGGSVAIYLFGINAVGASGAIYGLFGALFVVGRKLRYDVTGVLWLIGINVLLTFTLSGISWQGHLGGLVAGVAVAAILVHAPRGNRNAFQLAGCVAVLLLLVAAVVLLPPIAYAARYGLPV
ncbi:rhomboid family intramembrane serine protease [Streptosporangium sandarakinum]|uniref:rhomboid family intramembrane serine protease n=1 Tax=Streptosporangium sandarakinum TaxID=1260955 RepID=UPI00369B532E